MIATPILPGHTYRVSYQGQTFTVLAAHPCDAIVIALEALV